MVTQDRPQTLKQAKAAFKARGSTSVSAAEKRRLERGAVLLERATRLKDLEQRKKNHLKKKGEKEAKDAHVKPPVLLGTQHKLDKFGYKSSQFHLGAFLKQARDTAKTTEADQEVSTEPRGPDPVDDDHVLLDVAVKSAATQESREHIQCPAMSSQETQPGSSPQRDCHDSGNDEFAHLDGFIESSTQIARELSEEKHVCLPFPTRIEFSSFGSTDFDISAEDMEELDASLAQQHAASQKEPAPHGGKHKDDRKLMPPPIQKDRKHNPMSPSRPVTSAAKVLSILHPSSIAPQTYELLGFTLDDLESLVSEDVQFTQVDGA